MINWTQSRLGEVLTVIRGVSYKKEVAKRQPVDGYVPILRATNIQHRLTFDELVYVPRSNVSPEQHLRKGDIVIAASSGSRAVVGKAAQLNEDWKGSFGAFCFGLRPSETVNPRFIGWFLQTREYRNRVSELAAGVNINNLRAKHIEETPIRLPPLDEQQRIVAEIEKQLTRLDSGVASMTRVQTALRRYRGSLLKAACEGRLIPTDADLARKDNRSYETGEELLQRILKERREKWEGRGKYKEPYAPDLAKLPSLPAGWCWLAIDAIAFVTKLAGFEYTKFVKYDPTGDTAVIKAENASSTGFKRTDFSKVKHSTVANLTRSQLKAGDLLMVFVGNVGNVARVPDDQPYFLGPNIGMIRVHCANVSPAYLEFYLRSPSGRARALGFVKAVAQPSLSMGTIRMIPVAIPPFDEQQRIVVELERLLSMIEELEAVVTTELQRAVRLRQSILKRAFSEHQE